MVEPLAERGIRVGASTLDDRARAFAPRYEDAARLAGAWVDICRAIDGQGQAVDACVSEGRAAEDAATFFRHAIASTGAVLDEVSTECAAAHPSALVAALPPVAHETGKQPQQRIERDHQHLKGRLRPMRSFRTLAGARVFCRARAFLRNFGGRLYDLGRPVNLAAAPPRPPAVRAWDTLTGRFRWVVR